jgi:membrane-associated protein
VLDFILALVASPVIYLVVYGVCAGDAVFPVLPSESVLIALGVLAASEGDPSLLPLILVGIAGALTGDHIAYFLGRKAGPAVKERYLAGEKRARLVARLERGLQLRGGSAILVGRYVPGGRTAVTMLAGSMKFPLRIFTPFDVLAAVSWSLYGCLLGYWGGKTFENTWTALAVAFVVAFVLFLVSEVVRYVWERRREPA